MLLREALILLINLAFIAGVTVMVCVMVVTNILFENYAITVIQGQPLVVNTVVTVLDI